MLQVTNGFNFGNSLRDKKQLETNEPSVYYEKISSNCIEAK
jgi:hypothetical protein